MTTAAQQSSEQSRREEKALEEKADNVLLLDPDKEMNEVERLGIEWANADEKARLLEETKKTLLAQISLDYASKAKASGGKPLSAAQAEMLAYADVRFEAHLQGMTAAKGEANRARVKYDRASGRVDLLRSLVAARREEMRLGGFRR